MSNLKICRICLRTDAKMYHFSLYHLKLYYEELMALKVQKSGEEGLPQHFCYECATLLDKFHKFKGKCYRGQNMLKKILWKGPITYESIYKVDRKESMLSSSLSIVRVNNRVKTYNTTDSKEKEIVAKLGNIELDCFSEASLSDREDYLNDEIIGKEISDEENEELHDNYIASDYESIEFKETKLPSADDSLKFDEINITSGDTLKLDDINVPNGDDSLNIDKEKVPSDDASIKIHEEKEEGISPVIVYVESQKDVINPPSEKIEQKPKPENIKQKAKKKNNKTTPRWKTDAKCRVLNNENIWKSITLNDEEVLKEFKAKAEDKKYLAAAFKCKDCFKGYSEKDMLDRHIQLHHIKELGSSECRFCHYRFRSEGYLNRHMKYHYYRFECLRCNILFQYEKSALLHEEFHSGAKKKCAYCDREFRHTSSYYTHLRKHRSEHVCTLCGASFVSKLGLQKHKHVKHIIIEIESPDDDEVNTFCKRCDMKFETRAAYEEHLFHSALHSDDEGSKNGDDDEHIENGSDSSEKESASRKIPDKKEQPEIIKDVKRSKKVDPYNSTRSMKRKRLRKRERVNWIKPTTCHHCGEHFETQMMYRKHYLELHPGMSFHPPNERHICEICGASLAPGSFATHLNRHTRENMHTCDTCGRQFYSVIGLRRHLVTHTGEKPYACSLCDKRFTQSNSMKLHYRTFHLKQPYPKRNRRRKQEEPVETTTDTNNSEESSDDS